LRISHLTPALSPKGGEGEKNGRVSQNVTIIFTVMPSFERSAGVLTRSAQNPDRMPEISKALPLPPAAAGTAALQKTANQDTAETRRRDASAPRLQILRAEFRPDESEAICSFS
jgi:hypothetical protein